MYAVEQGKTTLATAFGQQLLITQQVQCAFFADLKGEHSGCTCVWSLPAAHNDKLHQLPCTCHAVTSVHHTISCISSKHNDKHGQHLLSMSVYTSFTEVGLSVQQKGPASHAGRHAKCL